MLLPGLRVGVLVCVLLLQTGGTSADEEIQTWLRRMHPNKPGELRALAAGQGRWLMMIDC